jgi:hypothetical protein
VVGADGEVESGLLGGDRVVDELTRAVLLAHQGVSELSHAGRVPVGLLVYTALLLFVVG